MVVYKTKQEKKMYTTEIFDTTYSKKRLSDAVVVKGHHRPHRFLAYSGYMSNKINLGGIKTGYLIRRKGKLEFFESLKQYLSRFKNVESRHIEYIFKNCEAVTLEII